ncbi:MAG: FUSC family protein [Bacteroidota bacterium]
MKPEEIAKLTDEELLVEAKTIKRSAIYDAVIIGLLSGIAIYSSVKNGFGLLTFLPLVYLPIATKKRVRIKELDKLLKARNLK